MGGAAEDSPGNHRARMVLLGPPGAGKSTLVDRMTAELRETGVTVGVLAVDPTSPFTGGALLGDRVRMQAHASDPGVFIRSMATRGHVGGLARATADAALVLDAGPGVAAPGGYDAWRWSPCCWWWGTCWPCRCWPSAR